MDSRFVYHKTEQDGCQRETQKSGFRLKKHNMKYNSIEIHKFKNEDLLKLFEFKYKNILTCNSKYDINSSNKRRVVQWENLIFRD